MAYRIAYSSAVKKQLNNLPGHIRSIARQAIAALSDDPRPSGSKELEGHPNHFRLWLSQHYRLVWRLFEEDRIVEIKYVGPKPPELYEQLGLGRPKE
jgi:mRNA-degrading endonuclease RelE of RelBE toxin-antitoxin system